jgi:hypothetical protein
MGTPRVVRIPRPSADSARVVRQPRAAGAPLPSVGPSVPSEPPRANRSGTQRAVRLTLLYLAVLAILYVAFVLYDRTSPGGTSPGAETSLLEFSGVAALLAAGGAILALGPAPRAVEWSPTSFVVIGRWGQRTEWAPIDEVTVRPIRRYPAGLLSDAPVESVEVSGLGRRPRNYLVESGLLPVRTARAVPR